MQGPRLQSIPVPFLPHEPVANVFQLLVHFQTWCQTCRTNQTCKSSATSQFCEQGFGFFIYKMGINNRSDLIGLLGKSNEITYVKSFTQSLVHSKCLISIRHSICDTQNLKEQWGLTVSLQAWVLASNLPPTHRLTLGHCFLFVSLFPHQEIKESREQKREAYLVPPGSSKPESLDQICKGNSVHSQGCF